MREEKILTKFYIGGTSVFFDFLQQIKMILKANNHKQPSHTRAKTESWSGLLCIHLQYKFKSCFKLNFLESTNANKNKEL